MSQRRKTSAAAHGTSTPWTELPSQKWATHRELTVSDDLRQQIERWARSSTLPHRQVQRSRILLAVLNGWSSSAIARALGVSRETVRRWRERAKREGVETLLRDRPGRGRRPGRSASAVALIVDCRVAQPAWTLRRVAAHVGASLATVQRVCREHAATIAGESPSQILKHDDAESSDDDGSPLATSSPRDYVVHL